LNEVKKKDEFEKEPCPGSPREKVGGFLLASTQLFLPYFLELIFLGVRNIFPIVDYKQTKFYYSLKYEYFEKVMNWLVLNFILGIILCIFVFLDAKIRRMNATFWLMLTLCSGILGAVFYILLRGDEVEPYYDHRDSRLMTLSERREQYNSKLKDNKRIIDETSYYGGINYVLKTPRYRDMPLDEIEYYLINIE